MFRPRPCWDRRCYKSHDDVSQQLWHWHNSKDHKLSPNYKQIFRKLPPRRIFINYASTISEINFHQKKILCVNLVYDHDDEEVGLPLRTTPCSMWESESKIYISACKTCWYILFLHPPVMKFASKSHSPLCSELPRSPPAPLSSGSRQFMTVK